jgi:excisionase family DNA binding protein
MQYFDEKQVSRDLNLSIRTLQRWRVEGKGPAFVRLGRAVRYPKDELEAFLKQSLRRSTSEHQEA